MRDREEQEYQPTPATREDLAIFFESQIEAVKQYVCKNFRFGAMYGRDLFAIYDPVSANVIIEDYSANKTLTAEKEVVQETAIETMKRYGMSENNYLIKELKSYDENHRIEEVNFPSNVHGMFFQRRMDFRRDNISSPYYPTSLKWSVEPNVSMISFHAFNAVTDLWKK